MLSQNARSMWLVYARLCPLYPRKQTLDASFPMSGKGHKQTHALQLSNCSAFNVR
jgi:hypothetical protein